MGWIQKATASIKRRGTKGKCTPISKPGCTGKAKALAKTFKKMARNRHADGGIQNLTQEDIMNLYENPDKVMYENGGMAFYDPAQNEFKTFVIPPGAHTTQSVNIKKYGGSMDFKNVLKHLDKPCFDCGGMKKYDFAGTMNLGQTPTSWYDFGLNAQDNDVTQGNLTVSGAQLQSPWTYQPNFNTNPQTVQPNNLQLPQYQQQQTASMTPSLNDPALPQSKQRKPNPMLDQFKNADWKNMGQQAAGLGQNRGGSALTNISQGALAEHETYKNKAAQDFSSGNWMSGIANSVAGIFKGGKAIAAKAGDVMNKADIEARQNYTRYNKRTGTFRPQYVRNYGNLTDPYGTSLEGNNPAFYKMGGRLPAYFGGGIGGFAGASAGAAGGAMGAAKGGGGFNMGMLSGMMGNMGGGQQQPAAGGLTPEQVQAMIQAALQQQNKTNINDLNPNQYAYGGNYVNSRKASRINANAEIEGNETINDNGGNISVAQGAGHEDGGIPVNLDPGTKILSDKLKIKVGKTKKSFATLGKKYSTDDDIENLEDPKTDLITKKTAQMNIERKTAMYNKLHNLQENLKLKGHFGAEPKRKAMEDMQAKFGGTYANGGKLPKYDLDGLHTPTGSNLFSTVEDPYFDPAAITHMGELMYEGGDPRSDQTALGYKRGFNKSPFANKYQATKALMQSGFNPTTQMTAKQIQEHLFNKDAQQGNPIFKSLYNQYNTTNQGMGLFGNKQWEELTPEQQLQVFNDDIYGVRTGFASAMLGNRSQRPTGPTTGLINDSDYSTPEDANITNTKQSEIMNPLEPEQIAPEMQALFMRKKPVLYMEDEGPNKALGMYSKGKYLNIQPELDEATASQRATIQAISGLNPSVSRANVFQAQANRYKQANQAFAQKYNYDAQIDRGDNAALSELYLRQGASRLKGISDFEDKINTRDANYEKIKFDALSSISDKISKNKFETKDANLVSELFPNYTFTQNGKLAFNKETGETITTSKLIAKEKLGKGDKRKKTTTKKVDDKGKVLSETTTYSEEDKGE